jgi:hypothetical protein
MLQVTGRVFDPEAIFYRGRKHTVNPLTGSPPLPRIRPSCLTIAQPSGRS